MGQSHFPEYGYRGSTESALAAQGHTVLNIARGGAGMEMVREQITWLEQQGCRAVIASATDSVRDIPGYARHSRGLTTRDFQEYLSVTRNIYSAWQWSVPVLWVSAQRPVDWAPEHTLDLRTSVGLTDYSPVEYFVSQPVRDGINLERLFPHTDRKWFKRERKRAATLLATRDPRTFPDGVHPSTEHYAQFNQEVIEWTIKMNCQ